jgi:hypothetical protein
VNATYIFFHLKNPRGLNFKGEILSRTVVFTVVSYEDISSVHFFAGANKVAGEKIIILDACNDARLFSIPHENQEKIDMY